MPAVLFECFFMDNKQECKTILLTKEGRDLCADWIYNTIEKTMYI
jgi:N-acetylmuramoyl-L-alanine amidase